jgi:hypothetical protein
MKLNEKDAPEGQSCVQFDSDEPGRSQALQATDEISLNPVRQ